MNQQQYQVARLGPLERHSSCGDLRVGPLQLPIADTQLSQLLTQYRRNLAPLASSEVIFELFDHDLVGTGFQSGVAYLPQRFGSDAGKWRWGDMHRTGHVHPLAEAFPESSARLNPPSVEAAGDGDVPFASASPTPAEFSIKTGPINRYIHDPSNWSNGRWIVPLGSSGHPASPHFADQQQKWARIETIPQLWDWDDIAREAETTQHLVPG